MMPDMDGFETCARLKARRRARATRQSIFLSALTDATRQGARSRARRGRLRQQAVPGRGSDRAGQDAPDHPRSPEAAARAKRGAGARAARRPGAAARGERPHRRRPARRQPRGGAPSAGHSGRGGTDDTLLISGPPGSDHEAVARAVHHQSARAARAIICVNCLAVRTRCHALVRQDGRQPGRLREVAPGRRRHAVPGRHSAPAPGDAARAGRAHPRARPRAPLRRQPRARRPRHRLDNAGRRRRSSPRAG